MTRIEPPNDFYIARAQKRDKEALNQVLTSTAPYIFSICSPWCRPPLEASDVTQETLIRIAKNIGSYNHSAEFFSWVYTVTYRTFVDSARKNSRRNAIAPTSRLEENFDVAEIEQHDSVTLIHDAIDQLEASSRDVLILVDVRELSYADCAQALGIPIGTVRSRVARARLALRKILIAQGTYRAPDDVLPDEEQL